MSKESRDECSRMYSAAEKAVRASDKKVEQGAEIKATAITNTSKGKLYRSLNRFHKFSIIVHQKLVIDSIWRSKKDKQRYLDYAFKIGLKRKLEALITDGKIVPEKVRNIYVFFDEHTTATNGCYELCEGLEQEFKIGTHNWQWNKFYPPLFPSMDGVQVYFRDSKTNRLIRAADIIANHIYHRSKEGIPTGKGENNLYIARLPYS